MPNYLYNISTEYLDQNTYSNTGINSVDLQNVAWLNNSMDNAFNGCSNLTKVLNINTNVTNLHRTFYDCYELKNVSTLPNTCDGNLGGLFRNCYSIQNIPTLPNSVTVNAQLFSMGSTFYNCTNLVNAPIIPNWVKHMDSTFSHCVNLINAPVIPNSVMALPGTFINCTNLTNIPSLPNSIVDMLNTFYNCTNLVNAPAIPNSVINITNAFTHCINLTNAPSIPDSVINMDGTFKDCINLVSVDKISNNVTNVIETFDGCTNLTTDIYFNSNRITNASNCFNNTNLNKNVHIPFYNVYTNRAITQTYNSFTNAGYDTEGTSCGVHLKNLTPVITINTTPTAAEVTFDINSYIQHGKVLAVNMNDVVTYTVSEPGYVTQTGTVTVTEDTTINITLAKENVIFYVVPDPEEATVTLEADGYTTVSGTGTQSISVAPGTTVTYTVEALYYITKTDSQQVNDTTYITVVLEDEKDHDWDFTVNNIDKATLIEYIDTDSDILVPEDVIGIPSANDAGSITDTTTVSTIDADSITDTIDVSGDAGLIS